MHENHCLAVSLSFTSILFRIIRTSHATSDTFIITSKGITIANTWALRIDRTYRIIVETNAK